MKCLKKYSLTTSIDIHVERGGGYSICIWRYLFNLCACAIVIIVKLLDKWQYPTVFIWQKRSQFAHVVCKVYMYIYLLFSLYLFLCLHNLVTKLKEVLYVKSLKSELLKILKICTTFVTLLLVAWRQLWSRMVSGRSLCK